MSEVSGKTVLVVEDDTALANLYKTELELAGYKVIHVSEGPRAIASIEESSPDLVLLDIMLPGRNGLEILQDIRNNEKIKETKIVILTNFGNEENVSMALELGAIDYIMKYKITPAEMKTRLASIFGVSSNSGVKLTS